MLLLLKCHGLLHSKRKNTLEDTRIWDFTFLGVEHKIAVSNLGIQLNIEKEGIYKHKRNCCVVSVSSTSASWVWLTGAIISLSLILQSQPQTSLRQLIVLSYSFIGMSCHASINQLGKNLGIIP